MFSLIITIISIALVAALVIATLYYTGVVGEGATARATAARVLQEGNQLSGALELHRSDRGSFPTGTSEQIAQQLIDNKYLQSIPSSDWTFRNDLAVRSGLTEAACLAVNKKFGVTTIPACTSITSTSICCSAA